MKKKPPTPSVKHFTQIQAREMYNAISHIELALTGIGVNKFAKLWDPDLKVKLTLTIRQVWDITTAYEKLNKILND